MAKTTTITKSALVEEIIAAFDGVNRGNGVTLHQAVVRDDYGSPEEEEAARARDTEARWQDVPSADIETTDAVLSFLDDEGFRYYLPSYMLWYLDYTGRDESERSDTNTLDSLSYHLTGGFRGEPSDFHRARFALLTPEQSRAVAHFVLYMAEMNEFDIRIDEKETVSGPATAQIEAATWEEARRAVAEEDLPNNDAQQALRKFWGQFLK